MPHPIPEADWKVFRQLREVALQRFCERVLAEAHRISGSSTSSAHERYLELYRFIDERDDELARAFNDARRSAALLQLCAIVSQDLLTSEEIARFSVATRKSVAAVREIMKS